MYRIRMTTKATGKKQSYKENGKEKKFLTRKKAQKTIEKLLDTSLYSLNYIFEIV